jgi:hypothetical protein
LLWLAGVVAVSAAGWVGINKYRGTQTETNFRWPRRARVNFSRSSAAAAS